MKFTKRLVSILLVLCLCCLMPLSVGAQEDVTPYIQRLIQYYLHYQQDAEAEMESLMEYIESADPGQGTLWRAIMEDWRWCNEEMPVNRDVLPDGLPQDDSLCIVILGFGLNDDGSMKEELVDRLVVGLASALKYPNAFVCVTGGRTADNTNDTEAGQMAAWLMEKGLEPGRILLEERSLSTAENARNVLLLLRSRVPQVNSVAVVSSDYHIPWGVSMFATEANYKAYHTGHTMEVVGNAASTTSNDTDTLYSQAWGISILTQIPFNGDAVPAMVATVPTVETPPQTEPNVEMGIEEEDHSWMVNAAVLLGLALVVLLIPTKKRGRKK